MVYVWKDVQQIQCLIHLMTNSMSYSFKIYFTNETNGTSSSSTWSNLNDLSGLASGLLEFSFN